MGALAQIIAEASLPEHTVTVCTAGSLNAKAEDLDRRYRAAEREGEATLAGRSPEAQDLAAQLRAVREEMKGHEHSFRFRGLPRSEWTKFAAEHPPRRGRMEQHNVETILPALIARCCVAVDDKPLDERLTLEDVADLLDVLNQGQARVLFDAGWSVNTDEVSVPFLPAGSETDGDSETR